MAGCTVLETPLMQQIEEISKLKEEYPGAVKVLSNIGEFTSVVNVQPDREINVHLKFQVKADYPLEVPSVIVRSPILNLEQNKDLTKALELVALAKTGRTDRCMSFVTEFCLLWLKQNNIKATPKLNQKWEGMGKGKGKGKKKQIEEKDEFVKKPSMKTAADVIKRLQWDESVDKDEFIVGYLDRIVGLVEKRFTAFTWEDLASVDYMTLAIPQHRIQYFKYKTEKVWDKNERLDNVFGSAGNKMTLVEAVDKYETNERKKREEEKKLEIANKLEEANVNESEEEPVDNDILREFGDYVDDKDTDSDDDNDDDDDDIEIRTKDINLADDAKENVTVADEHTQEIGEAGVSERQISTQMASGGKRFNCFVAVHIQKKELVTELMKIQDEIIVCYPDYAPYRTRSNGFHLTLAVMSLATSEDEQNCIKAMDLIKNDVNKLAAFSPLKFQGIGTFSPKVVFAKVEAHKYVHTMVQTIKDSLLQAGLYIENKAFNPHLTLFNVKKNKLRDLQLPKHLELGSLNTQEIGMHGVTNICVCRMGPIETLPSEFCYRSIWNIETSNPVSR